MKKLAVLTLLAATLVLGTGVARAEDISGTLTTTRTITDTMNNFVGNVTCTMVATPCISFGAAGITLNLNGFTMTGNGARESCSSSMPGENGITTNGQTGAVIQGPGLIRRFRANGIVATGDGATLDQLFVASTCMNGISVQGSGSSLTGSTVVRASLTGVFFVGIAVEGSGGHTIQGNTVAGASNLSGTGGGHGIVVAATSANNTIQGNNVSGNAGAGIFVLTGSTGNTVSGNIALGNLKFHDIFDDNPSLANTYTSNTCDVSGGQGAPTCPGP